MSPTLPTRIIASPAIYALGLVSGVVAYVLPGDIHGWADFHVRVFVALAVPLAVAAVIAKASARWVRFWPLALSPISAI